ncbi:glycosyltransferase [Myxococcota bacterium]|nr:glycosyltransferase [Myxococcota bacterium]
MRIGYLTSVYPAISHTFIRREIQALRRRDVEVETFTIRRSPDFDALSDEDKREFERTWAILPPDKLALVLAHLRALAKSPGRYVDTLRLALRHRVPGVKNGLWAMFHFIEGVHLARELERRGVEHLHAHFGNAGAVIAMLAAEVGGIGYSLTLHGSPCFDGPRPLLAEKLEHADFLACVSSYGRAQTFWASSPEHWDRVALVRCGVEAEQMASRVIERTPRARPRIVTVCRLSPEKGLMGLVTAFSKIVARGLDADLRIVGEGPERKRLEAHVAALGLQDRVSMPGHAAHGKALEEIADADVFAMASFMEGLPVVLMEAMALGTPAVAPRLTGVPELIEEEKTGLLFTPSRWDELEERLARLVGDAELRTRLAAAAKAHVRGEFDSDRAVEPLLARFTEAVARRKKGA